MRLGAQRSCRTRPGNGANPAFGKTSTVLHSQRCILHLAHQAKRAEFFTGKVMEFTGPGLNEFTLEEQAVLSNMAVECNALTAVMEPTESMIEYSSSAAE